MEVFALMLITVLIIYWTKFAIKLFRVVSLYMNMKYEVERIDCNYLTVEDIYDLSPREFEFWCSDFLSSLGYYDMKPVEISPDGGKDIICRKDDELVYVECKRYSYKPNAPYNITDGIVKKLVGAMIHDDVTRGIIITTGNIDYSAIEYAKTLNSDIVVRFVDWKEIVSIYNNGNLFDAAGSFKFGSI